MLLNRSIRRWYFSRMLSSFGLSCQKAWYLERYIVMLPLNFSFTVTYSKKSLNSVLMKCKIPSRRVRSQSNGNVSAPLPSSWNDNFGPHMQPRETSCTCLDSESLNRSEELPPTPLSSRSDSCSLLSDVVILVTVEGNAAGGEKLVGTDGCKEPELPPTSPGRGLAKGFATAAQAQVIQIGRAHV